MSKDIYNARSGVTTINNGSVVVNTGGRGILSNIIDTISDRAVNTPLITTIESKYDDRFDDPGYY